MRVLGAAPEGKCAVLSSTNSASIENLFSARLQTLIDSAEPKLQRIGIVFGDDYDEKKWGYFDRAKAMNIVAIPIRITREQIPQLPRLYAENKIQGALLLQDSFLDGNTPALVKETASIPIPTLFPWDEADLGAWMHFGTKVDSNKEAAKYIAAILGGASIRDLPVTFPTEYELVVNHKLAKEHGWVFPKKFLLYPQREPKPQ